MTCKLKLVSLRLLLICFSIQTFAGPMSKAQKVLDKMSLEEKIGQMLLIGFRGTSLEESESIRYDIEKIKVGSVILFDYDAKLKTRGRNISSPEQLKKLNTDLQKISKIPLFISVDEEGGMVSRLKSRYGFSDKKSAQELGKGTVNDAIPSMEHLVLELSENHFNMNFAPLVDVNVNPNNPVIGKVKRSFSEDEKIVSDFASKFIDIQNEHNIISVLKHFPGHGSSDSDSHLGLVDVTSSWEARELFPYEDLIAKNKVDMIMSAHVYQRELDPDYPATLSKKILTNILRDKLHYKGVVISDDMNMGAIRDHFGIEESVELAVNAGIDILLFGNNLDYDKYSAKNVRDTLVMLVKSGRVSEARIQESALKVLKLKEKAGMLK